MKADHKVSSKDSTLSPNRPEGNHLATGNRLENKTVVTEDTGRDTTTSRSSLVTKRRGEEIVSTGDCCPEARQFDACQWERMFNTVTNGMRIVGLDHRTLYVNDAFCRLAGVNRHEAVTQLCHETFPGEACQTSQCPLNRIAAGEQQVVYNVEKVGQDGTVNYCTVSASPLTDTNGVLIGIIEDLQDLGERTRAEQKLRESEELHRITLSNISDSVFITDDDSNFTFVCPNADIIFGHGKNEIIGMRKIENLLGQDLFDRKQLDREGELANLERRITDKFGVGHDLLINVKRVSINGGTTLYSCRDISDRKQAQDEIARITSRLQTSIEHMPIAYILWNSDKEVLEWNRAAEQIFGYSYEEMQGKSLFDAIVPEDVLHMVDDVARDLFAGTSSSYSAKNNNIRKDGSPISCQWHNTPLRNAEGEVTAILSMAADVTDRMRAEDKLRQSEEFLSVVYNNSDIGIFVVDVTENGEYVFEGINPIHEQLLGVSNVDIVGRTPDDLADRIGAETVKHIKAFYDECVEKREPLESEFLVPDGRAKGWWFSRLTPVIDKETDRVVKLVGSGIVITERKRAEAALGQSEERYRNLVEGTADLITRVDENGIFTYANHVAREIYGVEHDQCLGTTAFDYIHPEDQERTRKWFQLCVAEQVEQAAIENRQLNRITGVATDTLWTCRFHYDSAGAVKAVDGIARNITERKRAEEELARHRENLEELVSERTAELQREISGREQAESLVRIERDLAIGLSQSKDLKEALDHCLEAACKASGMNSGGIYVLNDTDGSMELRISQHLSDEFVAAEARYDRDSENCQLVMKGDPVYIEYEILGKYLDEKRIRDGLKSIAILPVKNGDRVVACLNVASRTMEQIPEMSRVALESLASHIGSAIVHMENENDLRESEDKFSKAFHSSVALMAISSIDRGVIMDANEMFSKTLEYSRSEIIGRSSDDLDIWADYSQRAVIVDLLQKKGYVRNMDVDFKTRSGEVRSGLFSAHAIELGGKPCLLTVLTDITERKEAQKELKSAYNELEIERTLLQNKNIALRELMEQIDQQKQQTNHQLQTNVNRIVRPMLDIVNQRLGSEDQHLMELLDSALGDLLDPTASRLERSHANLSPRETEVCNMIRRGFSSKQMASILNVSVHTVNNQRRSIRKKLDISDNQTNLETYLKSL